MGFKPTPKRTAVEHLAIMTKTQHAVIKELHLVQPERRTSRSDITWLVRFSIYNLNV